MPRPRYVDSLPTPEKKEKMKIVVMSCSRTATLGLYRAFKILGYKPYHAYEMSVVHGTPHLRMYMDAFEAENKKTAGYERYSREDFDKWLAGYDVFVEMGSYIPTQTINAYMADPSIRFLLTERTPASWVRSVNGFLGTIIKALGSFPMNILRNFNPELWYLWRMNEEGYLLWSSGTMPGATRNVELMERNYAEYIDLVKRLIPEDRLTVLKLEDGLGWKELCAFTGDAVPQESYPKGNDHNVDKDGYFGRVIRTALLRLTATVVPVVGIGAWAALQLYRR